jgi:hypothetical protein
MLWCFDPLTRSTSGRPSGAPLGKQVDCLLDQVSRHRVVLGEQHESRFHVGMQLNNPSVFHDMIITIPLYLLVVECSWPL